MEHSTPVTFPEDETFDVGMDTRTGVALLEYHYDPPFKFTGKIVTGSSASNSDRIRRRKETVTRSAGRPERGGPAKDEDGACSGGRR